jgi:uncharacterized membrane protein HdeD (DUF308 family)
LNTTALTSAAHDGRTSQIFLIRGVIAILWAVAFAAVAGSLTTSVTVGAGVLLVLYPLIDVVGSLIDARGQAGPARRLLLANAATSAVAAVALGVAAAAGVAETLAVFGVWATVSGAAQLVVALRRRAQFGNQLPMLLAGGGAVVLGVVFLASAAGDNPMLRMVGIYAAGGGAEFVIQAWLLRRRMRKQVSPARPMLSATA